MAGNRPTVICIVFGTKKLPGGLRAHAVHSVDRSPHQRFGVCRISRRRNALAGGTSARLRTPAWLRSVEQDDFKLNRRHQLRHC
jgi:hypothetical protein